MEVSTESLDKSHAEAPIVDPVEQAIDALVAEPAAIAYTPAELRTFERDDAQDELDNLEEHAAPLYEIAELAITSGSAKVICPFHDDNDPSCLLYADHFHCFGCSARGSRMDWLVEAEGMTRTEAAKLILEWDGERRVAPADDKKPANSARALALWNGGKPIAGTLAERYLAETRKIAIDRLPDTITDSLLSSLLQPTGAHPIDALLVFLHLLKGQAEPNGQLLLAHAEHDAPHAKSAADVLVDEVWCFHFARSADSKAFHRLAI